MVVLMVIIAIFYIVNLKSAMKNLSLDVKATCENGVEDGEGNKMCVFEGKDIFLDIKITNNDRAVVGFPLEYLQKTGPIIKLTNFNTGAETYVPINLADRALADKFTPIQPGNLVSIKWMISSSDLGRIDSHLTAEIIVKTIIQTGGNEVEFMGMDRMIIAGNRGPRTDKEQ